MDDERFHFIDLMSLHVRARLDIPYETRGLLRMMQRLSGLPLPGLVFFPPVLVEALRDELHRQHPWLRDFQLPRAVFGRERIDWAAFWIWVDVQQGRITREQRIEPDEFEIITIDPEKLPSEVVIIIRPDEG